MAEYKSGGLDSKTLAERKNKRLQEALSAYSPEQTKETVSKLLEDYVDESGKNYFGAGTRDTTLYFADDEYIKEIEKEKNKDKKAEKKESVADKLHKLASIIPKSEHNHTENTEENTADTAAENDISSENTEEVSNDKDNDYIRNNTKDVPEESTLSEAAPQQNFSEDIKSPKSNEYERASFKEEETEDNSHKDTNEASEGISDNEESSPVEEPTIVITPVKEKKTETKTPEKEDTKEMRREFFDNEAEVEEVPRRRRRQPEDEISEKEKKAPEIIDDEDDSFDSEEEDKIEKKKKISKFFGRKKKDPFDDDYDDEYDDEFDDDDYFDDDEYDDDYDEGITFKKVLNVVVIIALICSTAFFAASNYSNLKKLESANTQINELNNGSTAGSDEEINELKNEVESLRAENESLKGNTGSVAATEATTSSSSQSASSDNAGEETTSANSTGSGSTYTVQQNDSGYKICMAVYGEYSEELWQQILDANGMTIDTMFHPGDVLQIP